MGEKAKSDANKLYGAAMTELRENHRDEFEKILVVKYSEAGKTYKKRLTAEERAKVEEDAKVERARKQIQQLQEEFGDKLNEVVDAEPDPTAVPPNAGERQKGHPEGGGADLSRPGGAPAGPGF